MLEGRPAGQSREMQTRAHASPVPRVRRLFDMQGQVEGQPGPGMAPVSLATADHAAGRLVGEGFPARLAKSVRSLLYLRTSQILMVLS